MYGFLGCYRDDIGYSVIGVGDIKFKLCDGQEMLLKGVKHVPGLTRNLISLGLLHEEGWLYQAVPDKKTLRVMHVGKIVMVGERSSAHQYKLKGSVVEGGVTDAWQCNWRDVLSGRRRGGRIGLVELF